MSEHSVLSRDAVDAVATILPDWLATLQRTRGWSGLQAAVWYDGELVAEVAVGDADAVEGVAMTPQHRVRIASHSKTFTALAVMRLLEEGKLRLDDTLGERVEELAGTPVADLTLRQLLSHSAGLTRDGADARFWALERPFLDREQLLELAREGAVVADAGVHLQYSNIGFGLLGLVIEAVTGQPFADAVTALVLEPLDAAEGIGPDLPADAAGPESEGGFAYGHTPLINGDRRIIEQLPTGALAPATGFWATAGSIASFAGRALTTDELLTDASRREMRRRVWTLGDGGHYGLGLQEGTFAGFSAIGHSGGFPTGLSRTWAVPKERLAVSVIGTSTDSPASDVAVGILGLLALAGGGSVPDADEHEADGAGGGAGTGRPRPDVLDKQPSIELVGREFTAQQIAEALEGVYEGLWGRSRMAVLGGRLFELDEAGLQPRAGAGELAIAGPSSDPAGGEAPTVGLATWGDSGYGSYFERVRAVFDADAARDGDLRVTAVWGTGVPMYPLGADGAGEPGKDRGRITAP